MKVACIACGAGPLLWWLTPELRALALRNMLRDQRGLRLEWSR